jgi:hypothetical protein
MVPAAATNSTALPHTTQRRALPAASNWAADEQSFRPAGPWAAVDRLLLPGCPLSQTVSQTNIVVVPTQLPILCENSVHLLLTISRTGLERSTSQWHVTWLRCRNKSCNMMTASSPSSLAQAQQQSSSQASPTNESPPTNAAPASQTPGHPSFRRYASTSLCGS